MFHTSAIASLTLLLCVNAVEGTTGASRGDSTREWEFWALLGMVAVFSIICGKERNGCVEGCFRVSGF